jgi:hypothetical protein
MAEPNKSFPPSRQMETTATNLVVEAWLEDLVSTFVATSSTSPPPFSQRAKHASACHDASSDDRDDSFSASAQKPAARSSATRITSAGGARTQRSGRSASPVKAPSGPRLTVDKEIRYKGALLAAEMADLSAVDTSLIRHLGRISTGQGILPRCLNDDIQALAGDLSPIQPWMLAGENDDPLLSRDPHVLLYELYDAYEILDRSVRCDELEEAELAWNTDVHSPILRLALKGQRTLQAETVSLASICRPLLPPRDLSGRVVGDKMVGFCILFANLEAEEPAVLHHIRDLVGQERDEQLRTINQSTSTSLVLQPFAVAIETKATSGSELEAKAQLQSYMFTWLARLRRFLHLRGLNERDQDAIMAKLSFPVIIVNCSCWHLYLFRDTPTAVAMYKVVRLGDTHSLLGIYQLLASLRMLATWAKGPFWKWFKQDVLAYVKVISGG